MSNAQNLPIQYHVLQYDVLGGGYASATYISGAVTKGGGGRRA